MGQIYELEQRFSKTQRTGLDPLTRSSPQKSHGTGFVQCRAVLTFGNLEPTGKDRGTRVPLTHGSQNQGNRPWPL